jgi:hypothetical protein
MFLFFWGFVEILEANKGMPRLSGNLLNGIVPGPNSRSRMVRQEWFPRSGQGDPQELIPGKDDVNQNSK